MKLLGQVKDFFGKKKKKITAEQQKKQNSANPFNVNTGVSTIKSYNKRRKALLDQING